MQNGQYCPKDRCSRVSSSIHMPLTSFLASICGKYVCAIRRKKDEILRAHNINTTSGKERELRSAFVFLFLPISTQLGRLKRTGQANQADLSPALSSPDSSNSVITN